MIVIQFITIDGVVEDPDGFDRTPFGGWAMRQGPEGVAGDKFRLGEIMNTGVLLFGRRTWDHFSALWPNRKGGFADLMNAATKAVATRRPVDVTTWSNSTAVEGELIDWVNATRTDRDVVVIGSGSVVVRLASAGLVDEYRLLTFPDAVGAGRRLFSSPVRLTLTASEQVGPATLAIYSVGG
ncbi:MAG: dihydrofolate reductase family protein [Pseudolysinimonas sp.]